MSETETAILIASYAICVAAWVGCAIKTFERPVTIKYVMDALGCLLLVAVFGSVGGILAIVILPGLAIMHVYDSYGKKKLFGNGEPPKKPFQ